ncbi:MAG: hypothetical protein Ct9H300mP6_12040 [Gammaproteobacteria bacterium]|nr:MAG: hypothetical protein Ct9H300mP6_12040 [Gammaproteobacteria bacterium]
MEGAQDKIPVLIDGGFRRGTDIFKALALGARAVAIGRPQDMVLELLVKKVWIKC